MSWIHPTAGTQCVFTNTSDVMLEFVVGSFAVNEAAPKGRYADAPPRAHGPIPAVKLQLPETIRWEGRKPPVTVDAMRRYGRPELRWLAPGETARVLLPIFHTPYHPGATRNSLVLAVRTVSRELAIDSYQTYVAEFHL